MENIVAFPKDKRDSPPQTLEETVQKIIRNRTNYSMNFCSDIMEMIYSIFMSDNIDIESQMLYNDLELLKDALLSLHLKANNIHHVMQDIAEDIYSDEIDIEELMDNNDDTC